MQCSNANTAEDFGEKLALTMCDCFVSPARWRAKAHFFGARVSLVRNTGESYEKPAPQTIRKTLIRFLSDCDFLGESQWEYRFNLGARSRIGLNFHDPT